MKQELMQITNISVELQIEFLSLCRDTVRLWGCWITENYISTQILRIYKNFYVWIDLQQCVLPYVGVWSDKSVVWISLSVVLHNILAMLISPVWYYDNIMCTTSNTIYITSQ